VTGATGVAGRHIADSLERRGIPVLRVSRRPAGSGLQADITEIGSLQGLPEFAGVVHCAGLTPRVGTTSWSDFHRVNVMGSTLLVNEAVKRRARFFVYISTGGRLGRRSASARAMRFYVISKYLAERCIRQAARNKMIGLSLRAASLYGEHDRGSMFRLIRAIARGRFVLPVRGGVPKCLLYAGSLADVVADRVASSTTHGWQATAIADTRSYTLAEVVAAIESAVGRKALRIPLSPNSMSLMVSASGAVSALLGARPLAELAHGARTALTPVPCPPENLLHSHPGPHVALVEGVRREVEWMRASGAL
jgi:nucleoside-diphosphate-sugar epimerase